MTFAIATSTIVQLAFTAMEMGAVASFGDDSEQATLAGQQYDTALGMCLESRDWSFASTVVRLPRAIDVLAALADERFAYLYKMPSDTIVLREVIDRTIRYRLDEDYLRADFEGPRLAIRYTRRITNESALPATFKTAVAMQLAVLLAPKYVEVQSKQDRLEKKLEAALALAGRSDRGTASNESWTGDEARGDDWVSGATL